MIVDRFESWKMKNFAITGMGGYIAPRHLKAIFDTSKHRATITQVVGEHAELREG
jgi:hypothetical protein